MFDDSFDPNDLSQYTGAKFFDFDMGQPGEDVGIGKKDVRGNDTASVVAVDLVLKDGEMDFLNGRFLVVVCSTPSAAVVQ